MYLADDRRELVFDTFDFPGHQIRPGQELGYPYDSLLLRCLEGSRWEIQRPDGVVLEFAPAGCGRADHAPIERIRSRSGNHDIRFYYDDAGRLERVRDCGGRIVLLEYDESGRLVRLKLPHPQRSGSYAHRQYDYDHDGDLCRVVDALGHSWRYEYVTHLMTRETDRVGMSFYFAYDGFGEDAWCVRTWGDGGI